MTTMDNERRLTIRASTMAEAKRENHRRVKEIFVGAIECDPNVRADFVDRACLADAELHAEVTRLLEAMEVSALPSPAGSSDGDGLQPDSPRSQALALGTLVNGRYRIECVIGRGGLGTVYRAHDDRIDRDVAVKVVRGIVDREAELFKRFTREVLANDRLYHPNIARVLDSGAEHGIGAYLVMELLHGESLREYQARRWRLDPSEVVGLGCQICSGLEAAHAEGIVHRDIKPENIVLADASDGPVVKLLDFGIAKLLETQDAAISRLTRSGAVLGTPSYMSPEQCSGGAVDHRSDIYSLGCVLYEMLTGRAPFVGDTPAALLVAHIGRAPMPPDEFVPDAPVALCDVIMRSLAKLPSARYASASELRKALMHASHAMNKLEAAGCGVAAANSPRTDRFVGCARRVRTGFRLTADNALAINELCDLLGDNDLAMELVAAQLGRFSLDDLLSLVHSWCDSSTVLCGAVAWSASLLSPAERALLASLANIDDDWTIEDAEEACTTDTIVASEVLSLLMGLLAAALVTVDEREGLPRFRIATEVRRYAFAGLRSSDARPNGGT